MSLHALLSASLAITPHQAPIRFCTTWHNVPDPGEVFNALTIHGTVVRIECEDEAGTRFTGPNGDYVRAGLLGWWRDPIEPEIALSERQEAALYQMDIEANEIPEVADAL